MFFLRKTGARKSRSANNGLCQNTRTRRRRRFPANFCDGQIKSRRAHSQSSIFYLSPPLGRERARHKASSSGRQLGDQPTNPLCPLGIHHRSPRSLSLALCSSSTHTHTHQVIMAPLIINYQPPARRWLARLLNHPPTHSAVRPLVFSPSRITHSLTHWPSPFYSSRNRIRYETRARRLISS